MQVKGIGVKNDAAVIQRFSDRVLPKEGDTAMGMTAERIESLLDWLRTSQAVDEAQRNRPGLSELHRGRAEAFGEVIATIEIARSSD